MTSQLDWLEGVPYWTARFKISVTSVWIVQWMFSSHEWYYVRTTYFTSTMFRIHNLVTWDMNIWRVGFSISDILYIGTWLRDVLSQLKNCIIVFTETRLSVFCANLVFLHASKMQHRSQDNALCLWRTIIHDQASIKTWEISILQGDVYRKGAMFIFTKRDTKRHKNLSLQKFPSHYQQKFHQVLPHR